jgi:hypothetical protein
LDIARYPVLGYDESALFVQMAGKDAQDVISIWHECCFPVEVLESCVSSATDTLGSGCLKLGADDD